MSKVTDRLHKRIQETKQAKLQQIQQELEEQFLQERIEQYSNIYMKAYIDNEDDIIKEQLEEIVLPIVAKYAQEEIVDKPWKVEGESRLRRYPVIVNGRIVGIKTLGDQRLEKKKHLTFADGFIIDMKRGGCVVHNYDLPPNSSIYPPSSKKNNKPWDPDKFEEYLLTGEIFAPPDENPFGEYQWLTPEEYEEYKSDDNKEENRYPARDFYEMAQEEINTDKVRKQVALAIVKNVFKYSKS